MDRGTFSEEATFTCEKRDVYNVTIWINAIPCNGIGDCIWDKDELDCSLPNFILIVILAISITICGVFGFFLWQGITFVLPRKKNIHDWPDFDSLHESDVLKETMFHAQTLENYQDFNSKMVEMEMKMHDKNISEVVCCIKVKFSYATLILFLTKFLSYFCHRIFKTHQQQENLWMLCQRKETLKNQQKKKTKSPNSENYQPFWEVKGFLKGKIPPLFWLQIKVFLQ